MLARGHKVGFHPGYRTLRNENEFRKQKNSLEKLIGFAVLQGRQHVIRYDCSKTPKIWSDNGMKKDFTLFFFQTKLVLETVLADHILAMT